MVKIRTIKGRKVPLRGNDKSRSIILPKSNTSSPLADEYNRKRRIDFALKQKEKFKKRKIQSKAEKKQARFERVASLNLGSARQFLILTTPILVQMEPFLATVYSTWKFGKYGYGIYQKVKKEYDVKGDYNKALQNVLEQEIEEKVISRIKSIPIKNISQFTANSIWEYHKEQNPESTISPEWDKFVVNAMTKTFEEIGDKAL